MVDFPVPSRQELRSWREGWSLTIERAADLAGVAPRSWIRWESGARAVPSWLHTVLTVTWGHGPCDQTPPNQSP